MKPQPHRFLRLKQEEETAPAQEWQAHKDLLDKVSTGLLVIDERNSIRYANSAAYALLADKNTKKVLDTSLRYSTLIQPTEQTIILPNSETLSVSVSAYEWSGEPANLYVLEKRASTTGAELASLQKSIDALPENLLLVYNDIIIYVNRAAINTWSSDANDWKGLTTDDVLLGYRESKEAYTITLKYSFERATAMCQPLVLEGSTYQLLYLKPEPEAVQEQPAVEEIAEPVISKAPEEIDVAGYGKNQTVEMEVVLCALLEEMQPEIQPGSVVVNSRKLPAVAGDEQTLKQVLKTLLQNGIQYHKPGKAALIDIGFDKYDGNVIFCVRDNGVGLTKSECDTIFRKEAVCIGEQANLSWCKQALLKIDGDIWVESLPGSGSNFYFTVPAVTKNTHA